MSIKIMSWAWNQPVTPSQKIILLALADHADDNGKCWPGMTGIAKKCGVNRTTVVRAIKSLEANGFLSVERKKTEGEYTNNIYYINIHKSNHLVAESNHPSCTQPPGVVAHSHGGSCTVQHKSSIEPSYRTVKETRSNGFDQFWENYPKKVKKKNSIDIWKRNHLSDKTQMIVTDIQFRKLHDKRWAGGFIPDPPTYLNQERWDDEYEMPEMQN